MNEKAPLTILAMPKPFLGHIGVIQRNAIESWTKLTPRPEIILFGHEAGVAECAAELGLVHLTEIERNRYGTPLLADIFGKAEARAKTDILAYVNADIILSSEFMPGVEKVQQRFAEFLAVGRRTNLEVAELIVFTKDWEYLLRERVKREGVLESHTGIDFFVFRRGMYRDVPPLAIGRVWFDQWCIKYARKKGLPVVDMTRFAPIVHQLHDYNHVVGGKQWSYAGPEANDNLVSYGDRPHTYTILSATHVMTADGRIRRAFFRTQKQTVKELFWNIFVHRTRWLRKRLGLSKGSSG